MVGVIRLVARCGRGTEGNFEVFCGSQGDTRGVQ
jgi:hypothetical protein